MIYQNKLFLSFDFLATLFYIIHSSIYIGRKMMHYTKVLNFILYEHVSSIKKYCWYTWHLKHFISAIKRFCLNSSISIFCKYHSKMKLQSDLNVFHTCQVPIAYIILWLLIFWYLSHHSFLMVTLFGLNLLY